MISVVIERDSSGRISALYMSGHSGYAESGYDIFCASASTLFYTAANALEMLCGYTDTVGMSGENTADVQAVIRLPADDGGTASAQAQTVMRTIEAGFISLCDSKDNEDGKYVELTEASN